MSPHARPKGNTYPHMDNPSLHAIYPSSIPYAEAATNAQSKTMMIPDHPLHFACRKPPRSFMKFWSKAFENIQNLMTQVCIPLKNANVPLSKQRNAILYVLRLCFFEMRSLIAYLIAIKIQKIK